ncbi:MAG: hypothetical protein JWL74_231 [Alphaproteobacteria bacterium]|jgi:hypothetical protein|nr:hypothetical protein [Alphaproteobacteria bacterium]
MRIMVEGLGTGPEQPLHHSPRERPLPMTLRFTGRISDIAS